MPDVSVFFPQNFFLFLRPDKLVLYRFSAALWRTKALEQRREYPITGDMPLAAALAQIRSEFRSRVDNSWFLGLPLRYFTLVRFSLPVEAQENLDQAVEYALMRHVPYDISLAYSHYTAQVDQKELLIDATVIPKEPVQDFLEAVSAAGITLSAVFPSLAFWAWQNKENGLYVSGGGKETEVLLWKRGMVGFQAEEYGTDSQAGKIFLEKTAPVLENMPGCPENTFFWEPVFSPAEQASWMGRSRETVRVLTDLDSFAGRKFESFPYQINLVPFAVLKNRKKTFWLQMIAACVLALMLAAYPVAKIAGKRRHLTRIDAKIASLRNEASKMSGLRGENAAITQYLQQLAQEVESHVDMAEILKEVTEILPQDAWLNTMLFSNGRLEIRGTAKSATVVIEALENSPLFKEARFDSPVTSRGDNELFTIVAALE